MKQILRFLRFHFWNVALLWKWLITVLCLKYPLIFLENNYKKSYLQFLFSVLVWKNGSSGKNIYCAFLHDNERPTQGLINTMLRSSHQMCSVKEAVLKNFAIFTGKHLCWSLFLTKKACNFIKKRQVFSC